MNQLKEKLQVAVARKSDELWLKKIYAKNKKHLGSFNLFQSWDKFINENKGSFLVIREKAFIRYQWMNKYNAYVVHEIGVAEVHQGKGYARALMGLVPRPVLLKCNQDNEVGNKFYKKIGMSKAGVTATKKGVPQNIWVCAV